MKVMRLLSSLHHDEDERGIFRLNRSLIKNGHESVVIASTPAEHELAGRLVRDGGEYIPLAMEKHTWSSLWSVVPLARLIYRYRPDIVHIHSRTPAWVLKWALQLVPMAYRPITLATIYGYYPTTAYNKAIFDTDHLISVSNSVTEYIKQHHPEYDDSMITRIYRGVDTQKFIYRHQPSVYWLRQIFAEYPELEHKKWVLFPNTLGDGKGQSWLFDIVGNLKEILPKIHVIIMDDNQRDGIHMEHFLQRSRALGLDGYFTFVGQRHNDSREWLSASNVVLGLASQPESIGINVLKAIHLGTPVVAWNTGIYSELLNELYPQGLVKEITAKALCKVVKIQLKNVCRPQMTNEFIQKHMIKQILALYQELIQITQNPPTKNPEQNQIKSNTRQKNPDDMAKKQLCRVD
ncbi:glycosyltransferase [Faucicola boevrei]|uniref:glycosyltransferase n=1 Tax=Faucicola boevrei TaxID=346665 RepID=UPI0003A827DB|nr:glycosyltransferase [Moraxella boevrei]